MPKAIKAKPTLFEGVQYRSRLEARFAESLTSAGFQFQYEPKWVGKSSCSPDFLIEDLGLFVEVKTAASVGRT